MKRIRYISLSQHYNKKIIKLILDNISDNDFFYSKKINWEDWIIMRVDIYNAIKKLGYEDIINTKCYNSNIIGDILNFLLEDK